jgi:hypothetical protein
MRKKSIKYSQPYILQAQNTIAPDEKSYDMIHFLLYPSLLKPHFWQKLDCGFGLHPLEFMISLRPQNFKFL